MTEPMRFADSLELLAKSIFDATEGEVWKKRAAVAEACGGWLDAKMMAHLHETHGLSVIDQVIILRAGGNDLKVPYEMLEHEFLCMGKNRSSITSMLAELKSYDFIPALVAK